MEMFISYRGYYCWKFLLQCLFCSIPFAHGCLLSTLTAIKVQQWVYRVRSSCCWNLVWVFSLSIAWHPIKILVFVETNLSFTFISHWVYFTNILPVILMQRKYFIVRYRVIISLIVCTQHYYTAMCIFLLVSSFYFGWIHILIASILQVKISATCTPGFSLYLLSEIFVSSFICHKSHSIESCYFWLDVICINRFRYTCN